MKKIDKNNKISENFNKTLKQNSNDSKLIYDPDKNISPKKTNQLNEEINHVEGRNIEHRHILYLGI